MWYRFRKPALLAGLLLVLAPPAALACSTCKCGDYSITLLGAEKPYAGRLRTAFDLLARSETQGAGLNARETEELRSTIGLSYAVSDDLTVAAQLPWVRKTLDDGNLASQEAEGFGNIDLIGWWVLHRSGEPVVRHLAGVRFGVRLPTTDQVREGGSRLDIDVQPDAGAIAPNLGGWYRYYRFPWMLTVSGVAFVYGDGHQGFSPGDAYTASLLGQYAINADWALQAGLDARHSGRNRFSGVTDPDSGGTLAALYAGVAARFLGELSISAGAQVPVLDDLNGAQDEDASLRLSLAYDF
ncbi:hypothetical protein [Algiphilus sp.]|uniref:hypothetical protein n=1 Tax=Algiphilus sp. TaxID=1872431 RepID=UPI0025C18508|nr:hypothetical protein [Algiphilus sp.]MCK5770710.1 hypothetical protein [Algiphilus sp.]